MSWTRDDAIRNVLDASDGAHGTVDDGSGPRRTWPPIPPIPPSPWEAELLARRAVAQAILALRDVKKQRLYCFGSGKAPKGKEKSVMDRNGYRLYGRYGVCVECRRELGLSTDGTLAYHRAADGCRELAFVDEKDVPCPTCGAKKGKKCLTIDPVQSWEGKDLGRVTTLPHRARQRAAGTRM